MSVATGEYRGSELLIALFVALSVPVWSLVLLSLSNLDKHAKAPAITAGNAVPIKVRPVLDMDSPLLKLGGKKRKAKMPEAWLKPTPKPEQQVVTQKAHVSTKAKDELDAAPPKGLELSDAADPPAPDADVVKQADIDSVVPDAATQEGSGGGSAEGDDGSGGGSQEGVKEGTETDPLKARAASKYHARIYRFLRSGFACPAIDDATKKSCHPSASVTISGGTITGVSYNACGNAALDGAAKGSISSKVGQQIPLPPENYPELMQNSFSVSYVCK